MAEIMNTTGSDTRYGRGNMHSTNPAGNDKLKTTTTGHDARDKGVPVAPIHVTRHTAAAKPGRGQHNKNLMGG